MRDAVPRGAARRCRPGALCGVRRGSGADEASGRSDERVRRAGLLLAAVLATACGLSGDVVLPADVARGAIARTAPDDPPADLAGNSEPESGDAWIARHFGYRNGEQERLCKRIWTEAREQLAAGRPLVAVERLQTILDLESDAFFEEPVSGRWTGLRTAVLRLLDGLPAPARTSYEQRFGSEAEQALVRARNLASADGPEQVLRRWPHARAGFAAGVLSAARAADRGDFVLAAGAWESLAANPWHAGRWTTTDRVRAAHACERAGRFAAARQFLAGIDAATVTVGGAVRPVAAWREALARPAPGGEPLARDWPYLGLAPDRTGRGPLPTPDREPAWSHLYVDGPPDYIDRLFAAWEQSQREARGPLAVANSVLATGGRVVVRDFGSVRALDLATGRVVWNFPCESSLAKALSDAQSPNAARSRIAERAGGAVSLNQAYVWNSIRGQCSSDGRSVFFVDGGEQGIVPASRPAPRGPFAPRNDDEHEARLPLRTNNRLVAIDLDPAERLSDGIPVPRWILGGPAEPREAALPLAGHYFLGAPLPVGDRLFVAAESEGVVRLVALEARTGRPLWSQPVATADRPISEDGARQPLACPLAVADGVVVVPTQLGIVVGVDLATRSLRWVHSTCDEETVARWRNGNLGARRLHGHAGFPSVPLVADGRVFLLVPHATTIDALDLRTGALLWKEPRAGAEFLATVDGDVLLAVGRQSCRGLSASTGKELWTARVGLPAGHGYVGGNRYHLPLAEGRVVALDLATGKEVGLALAGGLTSAQRAVQVLDGAGSEMPTPRDAPGNLVAAGGWIVSAGPRGVVAHRSAADVLARLRLEAAQGKSTTDSELRTAELELALDDRQPARDRLLAVLRSDPPPASRTKAGALLRELLHVELRSGARDVDADLELLAQLSESRLDRARLLARRLDLALRSEDVDGFLAAAGALGRLDLSTPLPLGDDPLHLATPGSWVSGVLADFWNRLDAAGRDRFRARLRGARDEVLARDEFDALDAFVRNLSATPDLAASDLVEPVRLRLSDRCRERGRFQASELLLMQSLDSADSDVAARAGVRLAGQLAIAGDVEQAAARLEQLLRDHPQGRLEDGRTVAEFAAALPSESPLRATLARRALPDWSRRPLRAHVAQDLWRHDDVELARQFVGFRVPLATPHDDSFQLLDRGTDTQARIAVIDRQSGVEAAVVELPAPYSYPALSRQAQIGHLIPLGSRDRMHGLSLLECREGQPAWSVTPFGADQGDILRVGPAGPGFCAFQSRGVLAVVDPVGGRLLWQRNDLVPGSGLVTDPYAGLLGDDRILVLFSADRASYVLYDTRTGDELGHGRLDADVQQTRLVLGRHLFHVTGALLNRRGRIWDPLAGRIVFDEPIAEQNFATTTTEGELVLMLKTGRLVVVDPQTQEVRLALDLSLADRERLSFVRVHSDHDRWYVNLQRAERVRTLGALEYFASDGFLPSVHVQGEMIAVDRATGKTAWRRPIPQRTLLRLPHRRLPCVVALARVRDPVDANRLSLLAEIWDGRTGETIGYADGLAHDRLLQADCDPQQRRLDLYGLRSRVRITFAPDLPPRTPELPDDVRAAFAAAPE